VPGLRLPKIRIGLVLVAHKNRPHGI
jgi:hypothetical protein